MADFQVDFGGAKYDIIKFLRDHPGGVNTLQSYKNKSVLEAMNKYGHSNSAYHMLNDFKLVKEDVNLTGSLSANGRIITNQENSRDTKEVEFLEELEGRLDWSKPILSQLDKIAPDYEKWTNCAVYRDCRLFANPLLESMSLTPWYLVPLVWIPIITYMGFTQFQQHVSFDDDSSLKTKANLSIIQYIYHVIFGACIWTVLEYSLHRWVFHMEPGSSVTMIKIHFLIHGMHHKVPFDGLRQVFPPVPAMVLACILYIPVSVLFDYPLIKMTGGLAGYLTYDMIHYYVHHGSPADGSYLYAMKRYHSNHHFINHDKAFGISSKFWDLVFRTFVHIKKLGFSLQW